MKNRVFAIYGNPSSAVSFEAVEKICKKVQQNKGSLLIYEPLYKEFVKIQKVEFEAEFFNEGDLLKNRADVVVSVGGDGTFLGTLPFIHDSEIPVMGINSGRLGFLANTQIEDIDEAFEDFVSGNYKIDKRAVLQITPQIDNPEYKLYALNDITVRRGENATMLSFETNVDDCFLNNYWADGIVFSTPTGSTAYSLSCGGPILTPNAKAVIITPIASHTLTVRPIVISDESVVKVKVSGRGDHFTLSVDSNSENIEIGSELIIQKADFSLSIVRFEHHSFYETIRNKLMWGYDKRN